MIRVPLGLKAGSLAYPSRFLLNCGFIHLKLPSFVLNRTVICESVKDADGKSFQGIVVGFF